LSLSTRKYVLSGLTKRSTAADAAKKTTSHTIYISHPSRLLLPRRARISDRKKLCKKRRGEHCPRARTFKEQRISARVRSCRRSGKTAFPFEGKVGGEAVRMRCLSLNATSSASLRSSTFSPRRRHGQPLHQAAYELLLRARQHIDDRQMQYRICPGRALKNGPGGAYHHLRRQGGVVDAHLKT